MEFDVVEPFGVFLATLLQRFDSCEGIPNERDRSKQAAT
jgi:hypothetical protein